MREHIYIAIIAILLGITIQSSAKAASYVVKLPQQIKQNDFQISRIKDVFIYAKEGDVILVQVQGYGGSVVEGISILHAMETSKAEIQIIVTGPSYSMHAVIACHADKIGMEPYSFLMFHDYSALFIGKASDSRSHMKALDKLTEKMLQRECVTRKILTEEEVKDIKSGKDIYIHPEQLYKRISN